MKIGRTISALASRVKVKAWGTETMQPRHDRDGGALSDPSYPRAKRRSRGSHSVRI